MLRCLAIAIVMGGLLGFVQSTGAQGTAGLNSAATAAAAGKAAPAPGRIRVGVTSAGFDDLGSVLSELKVPFRLTADTAAPFQAFDAIFISCGTDEQFETEEVAAFVERGGVLYVSDLSYPVVGDAFPKMTSGWRRDGTPSTYTCQVHDKQMIKDVGKTIALNFDSGGWAYATQLDKKVNVLVSMTPPNSNARIPVLFTFSQGKGRVIYTSFHNHANANELERKLIAAVVAAPVNAAREVQAQLQGGTIEDLKSRAQEAIAGRAALGAEEALDATKVGSTAPATLAQALSEADSELAARILQELHDRKGGEATQALADAARSSSGTLQTRARELLAKRLTRMTAKTLASYLSQDDAELRQAACVAAGSKNEKSLVGVLVERLSDKNATVADAAHHSLTVLTGQDFGTFAGAGAAERFTVQRRWEKWHEAEGR